MPCIPMAWAPSRRLEKPRLVWFSRNVLVQDGVRRSGVGVGLDRLFCLILQRFEELRFGLASSQLPGFGLAPSSRERHDDRKLVAPRAVG